MKKKIWTILITALVLLGLGSGFGYQTGLAQDTTQPQGEESGRRTVTVSGYGQAQIQPDQAVIQVGVQTDAATAQDALSQSNEKLQDVIRALEDSGVAEEDITILAIQLYPRYGEPTPPEGGGGGGGGGGGQPQITGYTAVAIVEARVRDLENLGTVLDNATAAGANIVQFIRFEASDLSGKLSEARQEAFNDARSRAEELAALANGELGPVVNITEFSPGPFPFYSLGTGFGGAAAGGGAAATGGGVQVAQAPAIDPGAQTYFVTLQVTWVLRVSE